MPRMATQVGVSVEMYPEFGRGLRWNGPDALAKGTDVLWETPWCTVQGTLWSLIIAVCERLTTNNGNDAQEIISSLCMVVNRAEAWDDNDEAMYTLIKQRFPDVNVMELYSKLACNNFQSRRFGSDGRVNATFTSLFPTLSLVNHACNYNALIVATGETYVLRTTCEVQPGEQLTVNYVSLYDSYTHPFEFDHYCASNWGFVCMCDRCCPRRRKEK